LKTIISTLSVSAEVDAILTARLLDTRDGTTLLTDSARDRFGQRSSRPVFKFRPYFTGAVRSGFGSPKI
jgi:hypothetical protein